MNTLWHVPPGLWAGKTVAVLASGPSLTQELADSVAHLPRVCARWAAKRAPGADICIAIDSYPNEGFWPWALEHFKGRLLCGVSTDTLPESVGYFWHRHELVTLGVNHQVEFRNNGMSAIHIAEQSGPKKIILLGFEPQNPRHFYSDQVSYPGAQGNEWYPGLTAGLNQLIARLRAKGIEVEADIDVYCGNLSAQIAGPKLDSLLALLDGVRGLDGAIAELGVYKGGALAAMAKACPDKACYGFDTFSGLPAEAWSEGEPLKPGDLADVSMPSMERLLPQNCRLVRGLFPGSAAGIEDRFCLAHVDFDYEKSTVDAIAWLVPRMTAGGLIVFDDYRWRYCPGVARAIQSAGLQVVESVQYQCYWRAPEAAPQAAEPPAGGEQPRAAGRRRKSAALDEEY